MRRSAASAPGGRGRFYFPASAKPGKNRGLNGRLLKEREVPDREGDLGVGVPAVAPGVRAWKRRERRRRAAVRAPKVADRRAELVRGPAPEREVERVSRVEAAERLALRAPPGRVLAALGAEGRLGRRAVAAEFWPRPPEVRDLWDFRGFPVGSNSHSTRRGARAWRFRRRARSSAECGASPPRRRSPRSRKAARGSRRSGACRATRRLARGRTSREPRPWRAPATRRRRPRGTRPRRERSAAPRRRSRSGS